MSALGDSKMQRKWPDIYEQYSRYIGFRKMSNVFDKSLELALSVTLSVSVDP